MNNKVLIRNLIISLVLSALLGYGVFLFFQYEQFFSSLVRNIVLVCIAALFVCIWWIFLVDLRAGGRNAGLDDEDDDESGFGNPALIGQLTGTMPEEPSPANDLSDMVFVPAAQESDHSGDDNIIPPVAEEPAPEDIVPAVAPEVEIAVEPVPAEAEQTPVPEITVSEISALEVSATDAESDEAALEILPPESEPEAPAAEIVVSQDEVLPEPDADAEPELDIEPVPDIDEPAAEDESTVIAFPTAPSADSFLMDTTESSLTTSSDEEYADLFAPEELIDTFKPDVNTVNLRDLTPDYISLLDSREKKILATRIMREKRRRADIRAQQEAIMRTQELQLFAAREAARRAQEMAKQQADNLRRAQAAQDFNFSHVPVTAEEAAEHVMTPAQIEAEQRRQESVRNKETMIREAAAQRAQEEAATRQQVRMAQQAAILHSAEQRAQEQAERQEMERALRVERLRQETARSAYMEAERQAQIEVLQRREENNTVTGDSVIMSVQQQLINDREHRAEQDRLARESATQRRQEAASLYMLDLERRRQEEEERRLQLQKEKMAKLSLKPIPPAPVNTGITEPAVAEQPSAPVETLDLASTSPLEDPAGGFDVPLDL